MKGHRQYLNITEDLWFSSWIHVILAFCSSPVPLALRPEQRIESTTYLTKPLQDSSPKTLPSLIAWTPTSFRHTRKPYTPRLRCL